MKITFSILTIFLLTFLILTFWELKTELLPSISLIVVLIFFVYGAVEIFRKNSENQFNFKKDLLLIFITSVAALLTWVLNHSVGLGPVIASSIVGLLGYFTPKLLRVKIFENIPASIYCGSFVGMSSVLVLSSWVMVLLAGFLCGVLFIFMRGVYKGVGGKLGAMACLSVSLTLLIINSVENLFL